ncbi:MAG: hypothetical protein DRP12_00135 [Candidatus Aenigmatarchaeota archaeon]|nr:MAG: hypothetical protein DRP12_00135 [Candidatus Aenigmarchaeota archaeon]
MQAIRVKEELEKDILKIPGVVGIGLSHSSPQVLNIYVERLTPELEKKVPPVLGGLKTRVIESGRFVALQRTSKLRPFPMGVSIGHIDITAGTVGIVAVRNGEEFLLSNAHVFVPDPSSESVERTDVVQPGPYDGGTPEDKVGDVVEWVRITPDGENLVDAALARPLSKDLYVKEILDVGIPVGMAEVAVNEVLIKSGRTTGVTSGKVLDVNASITVDYGTFTAVLKDLIITEKMAEGGDSGSPVVDSNLNFVGLVFAGSERLTAICKAKNITEAFGIEAYILPAPVLFGGALMMLLAGSALLTSTYQKTPL